MRAFNPRSRPESWSSFRRQKPAWALPFFATEWTLEWVAYFLSNWKFLEVLEYIGSLSVLVAVLFYFSESGDRIKQKHYQAWQVINTAQGKGGSGGRVEALQELNSDRVPLVGVDVSSAFLQGVNLAGANLRRSNFNSADLRDSHFEHADFADSDLHSANFRKSSLNGASFRGADLSDSDLSSADLSHADLRGAKLDDADLTGADLAGVNWRGVSSVKNTRVTSLKNPSDGFLAWARGMGAIE